MMQPGDDAVAASRIHALLSQKRPARNTTMAAPAANLAGRWDVEIEFFSGTSRHAVLHRAGRQLDQGSHQGEFTTRDMVGTIEGDQVKLRSTEQRLGIGVTFTFVGTVAGDTISGPIYMGEYLEREVHGEAAPVRPPRACRSGCRPAGRWRRSEASRRREHSEGLPGSVIRARQAFRSSGTTASAVTGPARRRVPSAARAAISHGAAARPFRSHTTAPSRSVSSQPSRSVPSMRPARWSRKPNLPFSSRSTATSAAGAHRQVAELLELDHLRRLPRRAAGSRPSAACPAPGTCSSG